MTEVGYFSKKVEKKGSAFTGWLFLQSHKEHYVKCNLKNQLFSILFFRFLKKSTKLKQKYEIFYVFGITYGIGGSFL